MANTQVRHVANALSQAGVLGEFWTCPDDANTPRPLTVAPPSADGCFASPASGNFHDQRDALPSGLHPRPPEMACRALDRSVSARLASEQFRGVYAYEGGAEESFRAAGRRGLLRIYDVAAAHWQAEHAICVEEAALQPDWAATLDWPRPPPAATARGDAELHQADLVIVASTFLLQTLDEVSSLSATIAVLPPGVSIDTDILPPVTPGGTSGKLRVLFVGTLGQRKGLSYLFRACRELRHVVSLTVIGPLPAATCPSLERELREVRWHATASNAVIRAEMASHDVLLSPSLFDGFDPILLDAMAAGLPVIATPHTAAPDLMDQGVEGFIIPVRSTAEIVAKLELLSREPDRRAEMSANARRRAQRHTWGNYERILASSVATALAVR